MGSSGSTPSPPSRSPIRLLVHVVGDDHPKACTGRRLLRRGLAQPLAGTGRRSPPPLLLDPYARSPVSAEDRRTAESGGLLVLDCSWNRLSERGRFPEIEGVSPRRSVHRRLPLLIAGNPQHYGRIAELNTVEAFGAALWVLGRPEEAKALLAGFHGGPAFWTLNDPRLDSYARADGPEGIRAAEESFFGGSPGLGPR